MSTATFTWETRQSWGAAPPKNRRYDVTPAGVVVHYPGGGKYTGKSHADCQARMRMWQRMHMTRGSNDLEYGLVLCEHLRLMEARTERDKPRVRVGSNGTAAANEAHTSIQLMRGSDDPPPTDKEVRALAEAIVWLRAEGGWGPRISGHRDWVPTSCPGEPLYALLQQIREQVDTIEAEADGPVVSLRRARRLAKRGAWARGYGATGRTQVRLIQDALEAEGVNNYRQWQRALGYRGDDADGVPGLDSLTRLGQRAGFAVVP